MIRVLLLLALAPACVTRVQVCATVDRGRQAPGPSDRQQYDSVGGSVCADVERP